ncbi:MAG: glycosyltransferase [Candidatus Altiarchaeota archaeon]|nr:glycosyltransferase [Candidatus Altiarchaeota archaeon]
MEISVVIPTLNEERYIEGCLKSIRSQQVKAEIIVVDSKSTDKTVEIARKYADKVLEGTPGTISKNRQLGAVKASGDIIVTADADTFYPPDWLERITPYFKDEKTVAVSGPTIPMPEEAVFMDRAFYFTGNLILWVFHKFGIVWFRGSNTAYRKKALMDAGGYNPEIMAREDSDLSQRVAKLGKTVFDWKIIAMTSMRRRRTTGWLKTIRYYIDTPIALITKKTYYERPEEKKK